MIRSLNGSFDIETGLRKARKLLIELSELGLPLATEALDPDLSAVSARYDHLDRDWCPNHRITDTP